MAEEKAPEHVPQGPGVPVLPEGPRADAHYNTVPELLYANSDMSAIVPEDSPEAAFVINPDQPGKRLGRLLKEHKAAQRKKADHDEPKHEAKEEPKHEHAPADHVLKSPDHEPKRGRG